jgi:heme A synthase
LLNLPVLSSKNPEASRKTGVASGDFRNIARVARATLGYTVFVILFGAVVRITGSGAGCGQHWPTCNGEIAHLPRRLETLIELTHRVTSAGALVAVLGFAASAVLGSPRGHRLRGAAWVAVGLMVFEALIGAGLVLWRLVAHDTSTARAVVMPAHLVSTYALVAVLTLGVLWSRPKAGRAAPRPSEPAAVRWLVVGALCVVAVAATGALTALGDTLFPPAAQTLAGRVVEDQGAAAHGLQRLRFVHPLLAVVTAVVVVALALLYGSAHRTASRAVMAFTALQVVAGITNVVLSAPGWLQVVHLGLSLALWIALVTLIGAAREASPRTA